ncbi:MAG: ISAs1 family transposase [Bryobacteraceae bacterium]
MQDTREAGKVLHPVPEILFVTLCGFMAGAAGFEDIEDDGESKLDLLGELLLLARGVPSDDTRRFFRTVEPQAFAAAFGICARSVAGGDAAPDGGGRQDPAPQLRRHGQGPASGECVCPEARRVLAPTARAEKSNEISAIPELLRLLDLRGATVSMDASGCQREMAAQMVEGGGHYLLGLKGNQGRLHEHVRLFFEHPPTGTSLATHEDTNKGHGRSEAAVMRQTIPIGCRKYITGLTLRALSVLPQPASSATKPARKHASISPTIPRPHTHSGRYAQPLGHRKHPPWDARYELRRRRITHPKRQHTPLASATIH